MYENIIFIPYREREQHLKYFIENTVPLIQCNLPNTKVVVIEQNEGKSFNRGAILNIGFKEYENKSKYFITHDVDINPSIEVIKNIYSDKNNDMYRIKTPHDESLGGIIKVKHNIIFNMNGFPNNIWGWGIEDRALYYRCYIKNIHIEHNKDQSFKILPHKCNVETYIDEKKIISDIWRKEYIDNLNDKEKEEMIMSSGLNNIEYKIMERKMIHDIVELIKVDI
jgi:beta-1,4-galactosyltransferase 1